MHLLFLPGLDGGAALSVAFRGHLPREWTCDVVGYSSTEAESAAAIDARIRRRASSAGAPVVLVAESFSGPFAIRLAADPPPNLVGLVLVATFTTSPVPSWLRYFVMSPLFWIPPPGFVLRRLLLMPDALESLVREVRRAIGVPTARVLAHRVRQVLGVDVRGELASIAVPTLRLTGVHDRLVKPVNLESVGGELLCETLDAPHLLLQTRPSDAAARVVAFVNGLAG